MCEGWRLSGGCCSVVRTLTAQAPVQYVWGLAVVWRLSGGCLAVVWRLSGGCSVVRTLTVQTRGPEYNSHQLLMTTEAFSRNVSKVIFWAQVGIRQPSFMQEPTEKPLKVYKHKTPQFTGLASFPGLPWLQFLITCSQRSLGTRLGKMALTFVKVLFKVLTIDHFFFLLSIHLMTS